MKHQRNIAVLHLSQAYRDKAEQTDIYYEHLVNGSMGYAEKERDYSL